MEINNEPEGFPQLTYTTRKIRLSDGNRVQTFLVKVAKYAALMPPNTQNENITDPLYIESENSSDQLNNKPKLIQGNIKQYVPKYRRNNNVERHQQQLEILQQWGIKVTEDENLEMRILPEKDKMRQYVSKRSICGHIKETVEKRQESVDDIQQDVPTHTSNESENCQENPCDKLKSVDVTQQDMPTHSSNESGNCQENPRNELKCALRKCPCKVVQKRLELPNSIVNQAVEEFKQTFKRPYSQKSKPNASEIVENTEQSKDSQYHIRFSPGVSDEHRMRLLKGIQKYSWKCREKERVIDASWCKVTIENRKGKFEISGPHEKTESADKDDQHTDDDVVEHPAQRVKKKYQNHKHTDNENVELSKPLEIKTAVS